MFSPYFDRAGNPITDPLEWARVFEHTDRRVASTYVGRYWISTVWLGMNHNFFDDGAPLIFESMVFRRRGWNTRLLQIAEHRIDSSRRWKHSMSEVDVDRYATEDEALWGHELLVRRYGRWWNRRRDRNPR